MRAPFAGLAVLLLTGSTLLADFVVTQKVEGGGQNGDVVLKIKGDKIRADLPKDVSSISDVATGEVITLMHAQKTYLRVSAERAKELLQHMRERVAEKGNVANEPIKLTPTNRKEKVGEWDTEVYTTKIGGLDVTYWFAKAFPNYEKLSETLVKLQEMSLGGLNQGLGPNPKDFPGMPVRTEMNLGGKKITSTIASVKEENVDAGLFTPPQNYKEVELPAGVAQ